jgi:hypothetical protein
MPGLDPNVAVHYLKINPTFKLTKQAPRRMRIELEEKVIEETKKLLKGSADRLLRGTT